MKTYIISLLSLITLCACNDNYLEKFPESNVTAQSFFQNPKDLQTYTNGLYGMLPYSYDDNISDNIVYHNDGTSLESLIRGEVNPNNKTMSWGTGAWNDLRAINFMLDHVHTVVGVQDEIDHYVGLARFFRALFYWEKVKLFGDVPWYEHALQTDDTDELYRPRDSRALVMDRVLDDLEFAVSHMKVITDATILGKHQVEAMAARIALYEGTFRKYQTDLKLPDADKHLLKAAEWAKDVMDNGKYSLVEMDKYAAMFSDNKLGSNTEMIMYRKYDEGMSVGNNSHVVCDVYWGASQFLVNEFLMANGDRYTDLPDYKTKTYIETFEGRDPRLAASIMPPGTKKIDIAKPHVIRIEFSGYPQLKFYPARRELADGWGKNYNDLSIIRLAEVYVIYAEAKAELGTLTQDDLDLSINKLRARATLPDLMMHMANANPDPYLMAQYPNVSGANNGVILEIRRERRVEMAFEGLRHDDLFRWKLGTNMVRIMQQGVYIPALGPLDVTGDGEPDIVVLAAPQDGDKDKYPEGVVFHYLRDKNGVENTFYLENGTYGHIQITSFRDADRKFIEPKYYFFPIPTSEMVLNKNLTQLYGWEL